MARKTKAETRAEQMAELRRERDEARAYRLSTSASKSSITRAASLLREALAEHAEDAARWRARADEIRETRDRLRFALDVVRERDELRAAKGGAT